MQLIISGRGVVLTTAFKALVERKLGRLERLGAPTLAVRVTGGSERLQRTARLVAHTRRRSFSGAASADRLLPAVDGAIDAVCRQMRKARSRRQRARARGTAGRGPGA